MRMREPTDKRSCFVIGGLCLDMVRPPFSLIPTTFRFIDSQRSDLALPPTHYYRERRRWPGKRADKKKGPASCESLFSDFDDLTKRLFNRTLTVCASSLQPSRESNRFVTHRGVRALHPARKDLPDGVALSFPLKRKLLCSDRSAQRKLFVSLRRDHLLAAVETGRADVVTTMHFTGRSFDRGGRVGQKVVSTVITALVGGFLVLLNSHGKPHVYKTSDIEWSAGRHSKKQRLQTSGKFSLSGPAGNALESCGSDAGYIKPPVAAVRQNTVPHMESCEF